MLTLVPLFRLNEWFCRSVSNNADRLKVESVKSVAKEREEKEKEMADAKQKNDIGKLSFEDAIKALTEIVDKIEGGQTALQDSIKQYERGMALIKHCRGILQKAEKRIETIAKEEIKN